MVVQIVLQAEELRRLVADHVSSVLHIGCSTADVHVEVKDTGTLDYCTVEVEVGTND